ncbi:hypothetical protein [Jiella sonneratiae]|uniref:Uncharacterized protein n=1 Tax=Jiella sonneratiae TaxID=2816856 RepID=A0ABS3J2T3_9HYPH|nr:hypothetical protein [Jiella sonneratiae]MBO0903963.1 hypothetical protein [Jiella sonneratiae]
MNAGPARRIRAALSFETYPSAGMGQAPREDARRVIAAEDHGEGDCPAPLVRLVRRRACDHLIQGRRDETVLQCSMAGAARRIGFSSARIVPQKSRERKGQSRDFWKFNDCFQRFDM